MSIIHIKDNHSGGCSRNVRREFKDQEYRLKSATIPLFLWQPDADGSVEKWMAHDIPHDPPCTHCDGTGVCPRCDGTGLEDKEGGA